MITFKEFMLLETVAISGLEYEKKVYNVIKSVIEKEKIINLELISDEPSGFSSVGSGDIQCLYKGKPLNIEIKKSLNDQMGGTSVKYNLNTKKFEIVDKNISEDLKELILYAVEQKRKDIDNYLNAAKKEKPIEFHKKINGIPFTIAKKTREKLKNDGLLAKINTIIKSDISFIKDHYNKKNVFYINIGGAGLFYMGSNPLNLDIEELTGEIDIEIRIGFSGTKKTFPTNPPTDARSANLRVQGRLKTKNKSKYNLDNEADIIKLFS